MVKVWYYAGDQSQKFLGWRPSSGIGNDPYVIPGRVFDPLSGFWAETIAWLATARLRRPLRGTNNVTELVHELQEQVDVSEPDGRSFTITEEDLANPFGTKRGEIRVYRRLAKIARRKVEVALVP
jgi:hypothetical protein